MFVGVLRFSLDVPGARSLKDKRSVVRSLKERIQARLKVSIAEIGVLDDPRRATLGVAVVSNSSTVCDQLMSSVMSVASTLPDAVLTDRATEIIPFGEGGRGIQGGIEQMFSELQNDQDDIDGDEP
jgi:uncharacterized protein YlxP (DUF503 family)